MRAAGEPIELAAARLGDLAERDVPLGPLTTYRVGGAVALLVRLADRASATQVIGRVADAARASGLPVLVVGRGSNMLVADRGVRCIALLVVGDDECEIDPATGVVAAPAGAALPVVARQTAAAGLRGFEWAVGVPGSIGGAVRMNAGGHGSDMAACLIDADVADLDTGSVRRIAVDGLALGFRSSGLRPCDLVLSARLQLTPGEPAAARRVIDEVVAWRRAHQPGGRNAGSVFVNPVPGEVSAGALIDAAGLRGHRIGTAVVSDKHANFIQADDGGSADDVYALIEDVRTRVEASSGYRMRTEIRLVGFTADETGDDTGETA